MVHIEELTWDNVDDILKLKVKKEQKGLLHLIEIV